MPITLPETIAFDYEPLRKLGEGSNGETWLLLHRANKSQAVLKFLKFLSASDFKAVELFQREAELLKSVHVDGVPKFYAYCTDDQGDGYLLQEYIPYPSLQMILDKGGVFDQQEVLMVALRIACILARLQEDYSPPIIHRDIKPSNVLYNRREKSVWLIDFGAVANPQKRTGGSTIAGTFGYMPPEQMLGDVALQSDYYALGATILHLITGVFPGDLPSHGYQLDLDVILREKAQKANYRLREVLTTLLAPDIDGRPKNAQELCVLIQNAIVKPKIGFLDGIRMAMSHSLPKSGSRDALDGIALIDGKEVVLLNHAYPFGYQIAEGILRRLNQDSEMEYTFEAKGRTWMGRSQGDSVSTMHVLRKLKKYYESDAFEDKPIQCRVLFNRFFPQKNELYSVYLPEDAKK